MSLKLLLPLLALVTLLGCSDRVKTRPVQGLEGKSLTEIYKTVGVSDLITDTEDGLTVATWRYDDGSGKRLVAIFDKGQCIEAKRIRIR